MKHAWIEAEQARAEDDARHRSRKRARALLIDILFFAAVIAALTLI